MKFWLRKNTVANNRQIIENRTIKTSQEIIEAAPTCRNGAEFSAIGSCTQRKTGRKIGNIRGNQQRPSHTKWKAKARREQKLRQSRCLRFKNRIKVTMNCFAFCLVSFIIVICGLEKNDHNIFACCIFACCRQNLERNLTLKIVFDKLKLFKNFKL